jgi:predicted transport protein
MEDTMIQNLEEKTGKNFAHWLSLVKKSGLAKHGEIVKMLKADHGFTHGYANLVAHKALKSDAGSAGDADLVADQYQGKETLRPFYDRLIKEIEKFGKDIEIAPKRAYVSLRRKKQFALIQPSTKTRLDIGINVKDLEPGGKLEAAGKWNAMCSHRVRVESASDIDKNVIGWLKKAYEQAG